jgi:Protein of unknown function (DUF2630)
MNDEALIQRIGALVEEEHALERALAQDPDGTPEADTRLRELEVALDQCWDLLRQRRARRASGADPDEASARPADIVERYQQ